MDSQPVKKVRVSETRYRVNLFLLLTAALLFSFWFYRHLHLYVTQTILIGGTLTIWAVWKILCSFLNWTFGGETDTLARRLMTKTWATEYLMLSLFLLMILFCTTSSVYLVYQGAESGESGFQVDVLSNQNPYLERMQVTSSDRVTGRPFFFRFSKVDLEYRIVENIGFKPLQKSQYPWTNTYLRVPQDFERRRLHLLRLVAGPRLYVMLPETKIKDPAQRYFLDIEFKGRHKRIDDLRRQLVYTGALEKDLMELLKRDDIDALRRELDEYLAHLKFPHTAREPIISSLTNETAHLAAGEFQNGDEIVIGVGKSTGKENSESGQSKQLLRKVYRVSDNATQTIWLELSND